MSNTTIIRSDMRRVFLNYRFFIAYLISIAILLRPLIELLLLRTTSLTFIYLQSLPFGLSDYTPFAALFCVIPFADSFCEDYNSGYINPIVQRIGVKRYAWQKCLSTALSGGILMGLVVLSVLLFCFFAADAPDNAETVRFLSQSLWGRQNLLLRWSGLGFLALRVLFAFLFGTLWASVGLCISTMVVNRYVTFIAPFVIYQSLWFLISDGPWNPVYSFRGDTAPSVSFVVYYQLIFTGICTAISIYKIRRKVSL